MPDENPSATTDRWRREIVSHITNHPDRPIKTRALASELRIPDSDYTTFRHLVRELLDEGTLVLGPGRTLRTPEKSGMIVGTFRAARRGNGFIDRPGEPDVYVARRHVNGARNGDTVAARPWRGRRSTHRGPRAQIVRIIERATIRWVGVVEQHGRNAYLVPQGRGPTNPISIENPAAFGTRPGDLVVVEPLPHTLDSHDVRAEIVERLGDPNDARVRIRGIIRRFQLPDEFDAEVCQAAEEAADSLKPTDWTHRIDFRDTPTVTIDPPDARDYDDAISIEPLTAGKMRLHVHIADVAHFVPLDGPIDRAARERGTSVYFPGQVVPMLPVALSNEVCSLQPGQPRLTKTVTIDYGRSGQVLETRFASSVIQSDARLTYDQVTDALKARPADMSDEVHALLKAARTLARRIQRRRIAAGMIVLNLPEAEIHLDNSGNVVDARPADTSFSHTIIEMFMVEANEAVSKALTDAGLTHLRRVHPPPEEAEAERLASLGPVLAGRPPNTLTRESIQKLLEEVRGKAAERAANYVLLRSMPQAYYGPGTEGHFALASEHYCHFTSPIRRYPDLTVHRLLDLLIARQHGRDTAGQRAADLPDVAVASLGRQTSGLERRAQAAERAADQQLLLMFMRSRVGETFSGVVTGVTPFGAFVQLQPVMAEGFVHVSDFGPDEWVFDRELQAHAGYRTGRLVHLGQAVRVRVVEVDLVNELLTLSPVKGGWAGTFDSGQDSRRTVRRRRGRRSR